MCRLRGPGLEGVLKRIQTTYGSYPWPGRNVETSERRVGMARAPGNRNFATVGMAPMVPWFTTSAGRDTPWRGWGRGVRSGTKEPSNFWG